jgi:peroxiredoxin
MPAASSSTMRRRNQSAAGRVHNQRTSNAKRPVREISRAIGQNEQSVLRIKEFDMKSGLAWVLALALSLFSMAARAGLDIGDAAPNFTTSAATGGKVFKYSLSEALAKGPVVLYFFPAAFSWGCSIEAHAFAESMDKFEALGASVLGVSADGIDTLSKFSVQACQNRFPVASDESMSIIKSYDAQLQTRPEYANRITYVISPKGSVLYEYMSLNPARHVEKTLAALREWTLGKK